MNRSWLMYIHCYLYNVVVAVVVSFAPWLHNVHLTISAMVLVSGVVHRMNLAESCPLVQPLVERNLEKNR